MKRTALMCTASILAFSSAHAVEVTVRNDSLDDFGTAFIVLGFVAQGRAASWLTSPCDGDIRAVQIFWRSPTGTTGQVIHWAIDVHRAGIFPDPGAIAASIGGPVLTDGVMNEWRHLDENQAIPLIVPVVENETIVISFTFDFGPVTGEPSVVSDTEIQLGRNAIYTSFGGPFFWDDAAAYGVPGDFVIRAVVDCGAVASEADVAVGLSADPKAYTPGAPLSYTLVVNNAGPATAASTTVVDLFPAAFQNVSWTCAPSGGASCPAPGNGNITTLVGLPAGGEVVFDIQGTVSDGATGTLSNSATAVVGGGVTDPVPGNNTATLDLEPAAPLGDDIFADGFED